MKRLLLIPLLGLPLMALASAASAQEVVVLPGVVGPVGVTSGVTTQGPGTLTVGQQDINTGNNAAGGITTSAANTASINFTNSSTVTGAVGASGATFLNINGGANATTLTFNGPVYSTTFELTGTGTVNFNKGFTSNTGSTMDFGGDGFINVGAGQTVKAAITNTAGADTGTLTLGGNSVLDGAVGAASGLKAIDVTGGNALITGQANAYNFNLGTNTLNVAGALNIPVGGVINTTIFSSSDYGKIVPVGASTVGTGLHVNVVVTGPITNGSSFDIVDAASGSSGGTVTATSNTLRYAFSAAPVTNGLVQITTTQIPLAVVVAPVVGSGTPVVNPVTVVVVAPVVDALPVTPTTTPLLTAITLLPSAPALAGALAQLGPSAATLNAPQVSYRIAQQFQALWASHLEAMEACDASGQSNDHRVPRLEDASVCQQPDMRSHLWLTAFGDVARQADEDGFEGYRARTEGVMLSYDTRLAPGLHGGVSLRYAHAEVDGSADTSHENLNAYQVSAYAGYAPGPAYLNGALVYGVDQYSGSRSVAFPGFSSADHADYGGHQFTAYATTGYHIYVGDGATTITPSAGLQYTGLNVNAYTESGDPAIDLAVNAQHYDLLQSTLGAKVARDFSLGDSLAIRPEGHANWLHDFDDDRMIETAAFTSGGPAFTTTGLAPGRETYNLGGGLTLGKVGRWSVEGAYDHFWRGAGYSSDQVMVNFVLHL